MRVHPHTKSDVIFRYTTPAINKKSLILPLGGLMGMNMGGGERGHRFVGFRDFCVDVSPASLLLSQVRTPTTHLTRFLDKRRCQLLSFFTLWWCGGLRGVRTGGLMRAPILRIPGSARYHRHPVCSQNATNCKSCNLAIFWHVAH